MKRKTLSIPGCPNCHANLIFTGQALGVIVSGAPTISIGPEFYCIERGEA